MKNTKIFVVIAGIFAIILGLLTYGKTEFQVKLSKNIKVDTSKYMACLDTVDTVGTNTGPKPKG